ncbi:MAG: hypothetical protein K9N51_03745 [Candidatus Pacebacteria bacterium]|nr:hypothetical protein [Candidatus Paceibacterota bacterium]
MPRHFANRVKRIFAMTCLSSVTVAGVEAPRQPNPSPDMPVAARRLISFWNIGGDKPQDARKRFMQAHPDAVALPPLYLVEPSNWSDFVEQKILPEYAWGVRRWLIHNPFGKPMTGPMILDQYLMAEKLGLGYLRTDFSAAWKTFLDEHSDVEVIFYVGKLHGIQRFEEYLPERPDLWLKRALDSIAPILAMTGQGAAMAFDAASPAPANSPTRAFVQLLKSLGVRTYIESWPHKRNAHWGDQNIIVAERRRGVFAGGGAGMAEEDIQGEIIWLVNANLAQQHPENPQFDKHTPEGRFLLTEHLLRESSQYSVAAPVRDWVGTGMTLDDLEKAATHSSAEVTTRDTRKMAETQPEEVHRKPTYGKHSDGVFVLDEPRRTLEEVLQFDAQLGDFEFEPPANRFKHLPVTRATLTDGGELRVVQLGDSIMNDIARSGWMLRLENSETSPELDVVTVVRGTTGCDWYQHENRVARYVNPWQPDLVIIGGINNRTPDAVRKVVEQIRAGSHAEILLLSGAFGRGQDPGKETYAGRSDLRKQLEAVAEELSIAYFDLREAWAEETRRVCRECGLTIDDFKRDQVHANPLGEQIVGWLLARFLKP